MWAVTGRKVTGFSDVVGQGDRNRAYAEIGGELYRAVSPAAHELQTIVETELRAGSEPNMSRQSIGGELFLLKASAVNYCYHFAFL